MERIQKLSEIIVNHSIKVKEKEKVLITYQSNKSMPLVLALVENILKHKAIPVIKYINPEISNLIKENLNESIIENKKNILKFEVEEYDSFIQIKYTISDYYDRLVDQELNNKLKKALSKYKDIQVNKKKWVLLNYPSIVDAYKAKMSYNKFYNFAFDTMTVDYDKMYQDMLPLKKLMEKTDKVHIKGEKTDLTFSIKGLPAIICAGESNIPDGEVFTAPVKNSVNGTITFNTNSPYDGYIFENVSLTFKDGKIIAATCKNNSEKLNQILNTDEGSRYVGEFSLGLNPKILNPIGDILYDEKIYGSIHFTPGAAYKECFNGNNSNIHWDMVLIQRNDYGGGEIYFDDKLIRKDGEFVLDELKNLNYK